jgi:UDP-N-acetylmuramate--alanine ligase
MVGEHNVQNALATVAVALEMGIDAEVIRRGLAQFEGVNRRFTRTGIVDGITIIDDYGHHPVEISAVLKAARTATENRVIAVMQPHRYSRLRDLFDDFCTCFNDADEVIIADVYAAGEEPIEGFDRDTMIEGLRARGHSSVRALEAPENLARIIDEVAQSGDLVVCLGAGNITTYANALPAQLTELRRQAQSGKGANA